MLQTALASIDPVAFDAAADAIARAPRLLISGTGASHAAAQASAVAFAVNGRPCEAPADGVVAHLTARVLAPGDVCLIVSSSGANSVTLAVADAAVDAGATVIGVTSFEIRLGELLQRRPIDRARQQGTSSPRRHPTILAYGEPSRGTLAAIVNNNVSYLHLLEAGGWTLDAHTLPAFGDQAVVPTNSGSFLAMFATDPAKQAAAWELMQFMTSPRAYEIISTQIGYLPLRSSMADEGGPLYDWVEANPLVKPNLEQLDALEPWVSYPGDSYAQVDQVLATAIEDAVFYGADPAATMTEAAERAQGLIE